MTLIDIHISNADKSSLLFFSLILGPKFSPLHIHTLLSRIDKIFLPAESLSPSSYLFIYLSISSGDGKILLLNQSHLHLLPHTREWDDL